MIFYLNDQGEVCNFAMVRWADDKEKELEQMYLGRKTAEEGRKNGQSTIPNSVGDMLIRCLNTLTGERNMDAAFD